MSNGVSVLQRGQGENLLFLHGYLSCKESFYYQINYFSKYFKVTAFDFWGFGKSPPLQEAWSVDDYAEHTIKLLNELNIDTAHILAHSFGGRVGLKLLSEHGERFKKSVFTGSAGVVFKRGLIYRTKVATYRFVKKIAPEYAEKHFGSKEYRTLSPIMKESYKKIVNEDLTWCLHKIAVPVLFIYGKNDTATPVKVGKLLSSGVQNGELIVIEGSHFCFCENYGLFNKICAEYLL